MYSDPVPSSNNSSAALAFSLFSSSYLASTIMEGLRRKDEEMRRFTPFAPMRADANESGIALRPAPAPATPPARPLNVVMILMESTPWMYVDRETAPRFIEGNCSPPRLDSVRVGRAWLLPVSTVSPRTGERLEASGQDHVGRGSGR